MAGGGTGGHILPTLAVADSLKNKLPGVELLYIGSRRVEDRRLVEAAGIEFKGIHAGKLRRYLSWENFLDIFRFWLGIWEAGRIIKKFRPQVVFAKGGYVSLPVVLAAKRLEIPVVLHESDSHLGLANKIALKSATKLAVSWPIQNYWQNEPKLGKYADKFVYTGLPMAPEFINWKAGKLFENGLPIILITGGSQGAHAINEMVWEILPQLLRRFNVAHQAGKLDIGEAERRKADLAPEIRDNYLPFEFDRNIFSSALHLADLVISRSGSFVFELAVLEKPAILIPLPSSANDHQMKNAQWMANNGAAVTLSEELGSAKLLEIVDDLMVDSGKRLAMSDTIKTLGEQSRTAAETIAKLIIDAAKEN